MIILLKPPFAANFQDMRMMPIVIIDDFT